MWHDPNCPFQVFPFPAFDMGLCQAASVLTSAKGLIVGSGFFFFPAGGAALPNGHAMKREDSKGSLNSEGATSSPDQSENVMDQGLGRAALSLQTVLNKGEGKGAACGSTLQSQLIDISGNKQIDV